MHLALRTESVLTQKNSSSQTFEDLERCPEALSVEADTLVIRDPDFSYAIRSPAIREHHGATCSSPSSRLLLASGETSDGE